MTTRVLSAAILATSALLAWLAVTYSTVARLLQAAIAVSLVYVAYLALRGYRAMRDARSAAPSSLAPSSTAPLPWVSVVVAARNEAPVISATVASLIAQDYTNADGPRFEIVVVDDGSSDGTGDLARAAGTQRPGLLRVVRRDEPVGPRTKAAALRFALPDAGTEVIGVLDADARVAPDFLRRVMGAWAADADAVAIQAQRRAGGVHGGWLVAAQDEELLMDMASQCGRRATDGTAELRGNGMFVRRAALDAIGGWNAAALTEDLDLSTRLVAAGERIALAPQAEVGEEGVMSLPALWRQRMRWAEGSLRRLMEAGPRLLASPHVGLGRKLDFLAFTTEFLIPPLFVTTVIAGLVTVPLLRTADWTVPISLFVGYAFGSLMLAVAALAAHGDRGLALLGHAGRGALFLSHWLVVVPVALLRIAAGRQATSFVQTARVGRAKVP